MSIPHICPSCGNHISTAHSKDCCYGTPQYAHLGWPSTATGTSSLEFGSSPPKDTAGILTMGDDTAAAIRRLLDYLNEEPESEPTYGPTVKNPYEEARLVLAKRASELRKEADGIYIVEARAKRIFAADVLDGIIQEMSE